MIESLNTSESLASSVQSFPQKKKVVKKKSKKTTKQSIQPFLCFEGPTTAYFQSNHEDEEDVEELSVFDDELDDFDMKLSYKCGRHSSSNSKQSSIKQNKLVRAHTNKKEQKKEERLRVNRDEQKTNIQKSLQKKGLQMFGFEIYKHRAETTTIINKKVTQLKQTTILSQNQPSVHKYELQHDCIPKGQEYLQSVIDLQHRELTPEDYELLLLLDKSVAPKTVSSNVLGNIQSLTVERLGLSLSEVCSVCMEQYKRHELVKKLSICGHVFHSSCIDQWLLYCSQNCPLDGLCIL